MKEKWYWRHTGTSIIHVVCPPPSFLRLLPPPPPPISPSHLKVITGSDVGDPTDLYSTFLRLRYYTSLDSYCSHLSLFFSVSFWKFLDVFGYFWKQYAISHLEEIVKVLVYEQHLEYLFFILLFSARISILWVFYSFFFRNISECMRGGEIFIRTFFVEKSMSSTKKDLYKNFAISLKFWDIFKKPMGFLCSKKVSFVVIWKYLEIDEWFQIFCNNLFCSAKYALQKKFL